MDEESSAPTLPFQSPSTPVSTPSQTTYTYTTAGTIYNPSSSQRLQPPARRGRLLKATSEFDHLKFVHSPLPRHPPDALRTLSMSEDLAQTQPAPDQQISYEPLQQNYDRAVSPVNTQDQVPGMSWSTGFQSPAAPFDVKGKGIASDANSSDDDDGIITGALMNMPVKSLQNLASYPNPNQKKAQKVLLRGVKPRENSTLSMPPRLDTPFSQELFPEYARSRPYGTFSDPAASRFWPPWKSARVAISETAAHADYKSTIASSSRFSTPSIHSDNSDPHMSASMGLASTAGAPKPLTAGPPGQRQYRPSTFDSMFKAFHSMPTDSRDSIAYAQEEYRYPPLDPPYKLTKTPTTTKDYIEQDEEFIPSFTPSSSKVLDATPTAHQNQFDQVPEYPAHPGEDLQYYPAYSDLTDPFDANELQYSSVPSEWPHQANDNGVGDEEGSYYSNTQREAYFNSIDSFPPQATASSSPFRTRSSYDNDAICEPMFPQCMGRPACLTEAEIRERTRQLHIKWYAATGLLGDAYPLPKPIVEPTYLPRPKHVYGAIGDGRPSKTSSTSEENDEVSVEDMPSESFKNKIYSDLALLEVVLNRAKP
ncbi:hypothetical protein TRIATDRAFT_320332 [Trichoderma atroviride IMI 206040]|uniref:Uncharacterized protein n=1 Tax=Hypocrea atroviridis (strain ATCC 20476 / IMI 206040) TaxID=452589 RepID=G9P3P3_HYPAI|nr:uncharacterized protein TRIATDRAFT_320332 [Trichoderma atroviride IMI 206040]EHK43000.1 hypothetical protein TRIATDRAFT_320332 [Trichoderma atroviride IMI 206040]